MFGCLNPHIACRGVTKLADSSQFEFDLIEPRRHRLIQPLTRFGRRNAARGTRQQAHAQSAFQRAHGVAQRRLRDAKLGGRAGETAFTGNDHEGLQVVEIGAGH
ncbi:hypothetical protein D3C81_2003470 [compost metagenome]